MKLSLQISSSGCPSGKGKLPLAQSEPARALSNPANSLVNGIHNHLSIRILILIIAIISFSRLTVQSQPLADIGLYYGTNDTLEVKLMPKGFFNGVVSNVVFTLRWESGCNSSLGNISQSGTPATYIPMVKSGSPKTANGYTYQVFGGAGMQTLSSLGASWTNGVPFTLMKIPVANPSGTFEVINDSWTGVVTNNGDYFVSLNGLKKTGAIAPGKYSFVQTGTASICQGDSILLGGVYRKLPGTYYDTLQGACHRIVLTTLTVSNSATVHRSASICEGGSYFAGGAWQTVSGTYYDSISVGNGCDSVIVTHLTVNPAYLQEIHIQLCQGQSIIAGGDYRTTTGVYYDTLMSRHGCDSIIATNLMVLPYLSSTINPSICAGQSYFAGGASQTTSGTYHDTLLSSGGCDSIVTTHLTVNINPVVTISPSSISVCSGTSATLTASGGISYIWNVGATSTAISVSPPISTSYSVTATNANGCTAAASRTVMVNSSPASSISPASVSICIGSGATLTASGGVSYIWSNGAANSSINVSPAVTTNYSVTVTDGSGCTASASRTITVNVLPTASISPASVVICSGASATLTASGGSLYSWNTGVTSAGIIVNPTATAAYSVTVTNANGCSAAASRTVTVNAIPAAAIAPATVAVCSGESATLTASGGVSYSWSAGVADANLPVSPAVTTVYSVIVTNANGCTAAAARTVTVNSQPVAAISPAAAAICNGASATLTASGGVSYAWSTGAASASIVVNPSSAANYSVTVTDGNGCTASTSRSVTVNSLPTASISPSSVAICRGSHASLTADGGISYSWNTGSTNASINVNPINTASYSVTVTNSNGCTATASRTVIINPLPASSISPALVSICSGQSATLTASGGVTYRWSNGAANASITVSPAITSGYAVTVTDANGCTAATARTVSVNALPTPAIAPATAAICVGESATLTASGGTVYSWSTGASNTSITVNPVSVTNYSVTVTGSNGCSAAASRTVTVNALPVAVVIPSSATICTGSNTTLIASGGVAYSWSTGSSNASIMVSPVSNATYFATVTDANGCADTASVHVEVIPSLTATISPSNPVICSGQSVGLSATGGTFYSWSNGSTSSNITASPATSATYSVTVSDGGNCFASASKTVMVNDTPAAGIFPASISICQGTTTRLTANGSGSYLWSTGAVTADVFVTPSATTTYSVAVIGLNGCAGSASRIVTVNPLPLVSISPPVASVCRGESITLVASGGASYSWNNAALTASNTVSPLSNTIYSVTVSTAQGCVGSGSRLVAVKQSATGTANAHICDGESYFAGGALRTISGIYYDTLTARNGCDSIVTTNLSVHPAYLVVFDVAVCEGSGIMVGGSYRTQPGIYHDTLSSRFGCDSIIAINLTVNPYVYQNLNISSCRGESVFAGGSYQTTPGVYYDTLTALTGCDTVRITNLAFFDADTTIIDILLFSGGSYYAGGDWQTVSGIYYDTLASAQGCDSIVMTFISVENIESELTVNTVNQTMTIRSSLEKDYADNTYGATAIGWGVSRTLDSLIASDHLQWALYDASGMRKLDFKVDYFSNSLDVPSGYKSMGVEGGDGKMLIGSDSSILSSTTSINENFNTYGYVLTQNSPATDTNYSSNPAYPKWIYDVWYEATVKLDAFGNAGFGFHDVVSAHASPDKDDIYATHEPDSIIPRVCPRDENIKIIICEGGSYFVGGANQTTPGIYRDTIFTADNCTIVVTSNLIVLPVAMTEVNVSLCPGETYFAGGSLRSAAGTYYDTLAAASGCDSIVATLIEMLPDYNQHVFIGICSGESYFAGGALQTTSGTYSDVHIASNGCDSTVITHLNVLPDYQSANSATICEGDSIFAGGAYQRNPGAYSDTLAAVNGCDSIVVTTVTVQQIAVEWVGAEICEGDSIFAGGAYQTESGDYLDMFQGWRCDSVVITTLRVIDPVIETVPISICSGESYFAGGAGQTASGTYYDTLAAASGCDSIVATVLQVNAAYAHLISVAICNGESFFAGGANQTSSGTYIDTFTSSSGCDSVVTTNLAVLPVYQTAVEIELCSGESYFAGGDDQSASGIYRDTLTAANGCDSVVVTTITVNPVYSLASEVSICSGDSFFAGGSFKSAAGVYSDSFISSDGCDSVIVTDLRIKPAHLAERDARICNADSLFAGGNWQSASGIYYDTLANVYGCDSIVRTNLTVASLIQMSLDVSICPGDSLFAGGGYRHSAGSYHDTLTASGGCDSVVITNLSIRSIASENITMEVCAGEGVFAGGGFQTTSGTYVDTLAAATGCDSIVTTTLIVLPKNIVTINATICEGETHFAGGAAQNSSGVYRDTFTALNGCDSVAVTMLTVNSVYARTQEIFICDEDSFFAGGAFRKTAGFYHDTLTAMNGCDSIVMTDLKINPISLSEVDASICDGDSLFAGWGWQTAEGIYYDTFANRFGCDSIVRTNLTIEPVAHTNLDISICEGESYFAGGASRDSTGTYFDTLIAATGCDSVVITDLSITPILFKYIAIELCAGDSAHAGGRFRNDAGVYYDTLPQASGCDSIIITQISIIYPVADSVFAAICDNQSIFAGGEWRNTAGIYYDTFTASTGCDSVAVTVLDVVSTFDDSVNVSICEGESYFAGGANRTTTGRYLDTFISVSGCDSFVTTILKVWENESSNNPVTICAGQSYFAGGQARTTSGIYLDTLSGIHGCDSVVLTNLSVAPAVTNTVSIDICDNEQYFAQGNWQTTSGIYVDTLATPAGCDSIVTTILRVNETYLVNRDVFICSGESIFLQGGFRNSPGLYYDSIVSINGCDSIIATNLIIKNHSLTLRTISICEGETYFTGSGNQNADGIYYDTMTSSNGCDSVVATTLIVIASKVTPVQIIICEGESYVAAGLPRIASGIYYDTLAAASGCDSIIVTDLRVIPSKRTSLNISICNGESYFAGGASRTASGTYNDTLKSEEGCDSIIITVLTVLPKYSVIVPVSICEGESYFAGGGYQTDEGAYFDTLVAGNGCDSIVVTSLKVLPAFTGSNQVTICAHETYFAGGVYQNTAGVYVDTFISRLGCDSIVTTELIVLPDFTASNPVSVCEGSGYFAQGAFRTVSGTYYDTLSASNGCLDIIVTELNVLAASRTSLSVSVCDGERYFAQGDWQSSSGIYYDTLIASSGCDSFATTYLTVLPNRSDTVHVEICSNESYFAQGAFRNTSGLYYDILSAANGCDSTVVTSLTVLPVRSHSTNAAICEGEFYLAGGAARTISGVYRDTLTASNGCDSVVTTNLTVLPVPIASLNYEMCQGDSFFAAGEYQFAGGIYYDTMTASSGCDSIIVTNISVNPAHVVNTEVSICNGETHFAGGALQNSTGIYFDTLANTFGCDSVIATDLTVWNHITTSITAVICLGDSYYAGGAMQTQSGTYFDYLTGSHGCDSTVVTNLTVVQTEYHSNAITICTGDSVFLQGAYRKLPGSYQDAFAGSHGCDSIVKTQLIVKPSSVVNRFFTICFNESIFLGGGNQSSPGIYYDTLTAFNGCDSIIVSHLTVLPSASSNLSYAICDGEGMFLAGAFRTTSGIYVDTLIASSGCDSVVTATLQVNPNPVADAGSDQTICYGETVTLAAAGGDSYMWSTTETTASISLTPLNSVTISVTATSSFGCSDADSVVIHVDSLLFVSFTGLDTAYCSNDEGDTLTGYPSGGSFNGAGIIGSFFNPATLASGYHVITYMYANPQGCQASSSLMVRVKAAQAASFTGLDSSYCLNAPAGTLTGRPAGGAFSGAGMSGNVFRPADAGTGNHLITYRFTTAEGCASENSQPVNVQAIPQVSFQLNDSIKCITEPPLVLQATPAGGAFSGAGVTDSSFYPMIAGVGYHAVAYAVTDANGCSASLSRIIHVRKNPEALFERLAPGYCVSRGDILLGASPQGGLFIGDGITADYFNTQHAGVGEHLITYLYVDAYGCAATDTARILVYQTPHVEIEGLGEQYCMDASPVYLSGVPSGGTFSGAGVVVNVFDPDRAGAGGPYPVSYSYADAHGCASADTQWVTINPLPVLGIDSARLNYCLDGSIIELPLSPDGGVFIGPGISDNKFDPSQAGLGTHGIIYTFTDSNRCSSNITIAVVVEVCSGISDIASENWHIYPNPFIDLIQLRTDSHPSAIDIRLTDILGQTVFRETIPLLNGVNTISLKIPGWLAPGIYHIEILSGDKMFMKKLLKSE